MTVSDLKTVLRLAGPPPPGVRARWVMRKDTAVSIFRWMKYADYSSPEYEEGMPLLGIDIYVDRLAEDSVRLEWVPWEGEQ